MGNVFEAALCVGFACSFGRTLLTRLYSLALQKEHQIGEHLSSLEKCPFLVLKSSGAKPLGLAGAFMKQSEMKYKKLTLEISEMGKKPPSIRVDKDRMCKAI